VARRVAWTESAWRELESAANFIALDSPRYAAAFIEQAKSTARSLKTSPNRGRVVPEVGDHALRELFLGSHRLIYEVHADRVIVIAFIHGARQLRL
jgi:toxin ParE1/3/4